MFASQIGEPRKARHLIVVQLRRAIKAVDRWNRAELHENVVITNVVEPIAEAAQSSRRFAQSPLAGNQQSTAAEADCRGMDELALFDLCPPMEKAPQWRCHRPIGQCGRCRGPIHAGRCDGIEKAQRILTPCIGALVRLRFPSSRCRPDFVKHPREVGGGTISMPVDSLSQIWNTASG